AHGVAVQNHIENGYGKPSRGKAVEHAGAAAAQHPDRLLEGDGGDSRHQNYVGAANLLLDFCWWVLNFGIDGDACAFVAGDKWRNRFDRPVAFRGVQIGVTHAGGDNFYQSLSRAQGGHWNFLNDEGLAEFFD